MATYRLFPSTSGPASPASYGGNFIAGLNFTVSGGTWFAGYWLWCCDSGQSTSAVTCALWSVTGTSTGSVIAAATVTSGTLTPGAWNWIPLAQPIQLAPGPLYVAAIGMVGDFPDTDGAFGSAGTYSGGIASGPLKAYSDQSGSAPAPYGRAQGVFSTASADATVTLPSQASSSNNFWVDVEISTTLPTGYAGSYRLWANTVAVTSATVTDSAVAYTLATEIHLAQACTLNNVWYYSPPGTAQLATRADVWSISGETAVASITSPSWSGAAGSGWVSAAFPAGTTLPGGAYKVSVYNGNASPDGWSAKDASTEYWSAGAGASGITAGPLSAPNLADAATAYVFDGSLPGSTPPLTNGSQEPGQATFCMPPASGYPYLYVDGLAQNYWVDLEATPRPGGGSLLLAALI
jgi:hypothetical protein